MPAAPEYLFHIEIRTHMRRREYHAEHRGDQMERYKEWILNIIETLEKPEFPVAV